MAERTIRAEEVRPGMLLAAPMGNPWRRVISVTTKRHADKPHDSTHIECESGGAGVPPDTMLSVREDEPDHCCGPCRPPFPPPSEHRWTGAERRDALVLVNGFRRLRSDPRSSPDVVELATQAEAFVHKALRPEPVGGT